MEQAAVRPLSLLITPCWSPALCPESGQAISLGSQPVPMLDRGTYLTYEDPSRGLQWIDLGGVMPAIVAWTARAARECYWLGWRALPFFAPSIVVVVAATVRRRLRLRWRLWAPLVPVASGSIDFFLLTVSSIPGYYARSPTSTISFLSQSPRAINASSTYLLAPLGRGINCKLLSPSSCSEDPQTQIRAKQPTNQQICRPRLNLNAPPPPTLLVLSPPLSPLGLDRLLHFGFPRSAFLRSKPVSRPGHSRSRHSAVCPIDSRPAARHKLSSSPSNFDPFDSLHAKPFGITHHPRSVHDLSAAHRLHSPAHGFHDPRIPVAWDAVATFDTPTPTASTQPCAISALGLITL
ncbi:hypothetical protein FALBO_16092 [Fusarium albosuccineum]|uniref:Uncharacterized protein n=1 Tax=Fusarium albosuccineum TaxID=1237068 RepID=A0A8H4KNG4_9HYPO|nr:hypothetical protein FALBO_16092 [Fusarium albosuccineum]